jgi:hypothetical protein
MIRGQPHIPCELELYYCKGLYSTLGHHDIPLSRRRIVRHSAASKSMPSQLQYMAFQCLYVYYRSFRVCVRQLARVEVSLPVGHYIQCQVEGV